MNLRETNETKREIASSAPRSSHAQSALPLGRREPQVYKRGNILIAMTDQKENQSKLNAYRRDEPHETKKLPVDDASGVPGRAGDQSSPAGQDAPATDKQLAYLRRLGVETSYGISKREASERIATALARRQQDY